MNPETNQFKEILEEMVEELKPTQKKPPSRRVVHPVSIDDADRIARVTGKPFGKGGAYSSNAYTPTAWRSCCRMLARRGFSIKQIRDIMCSKYTRWASDGRKAEAWGHATSKDLERFLDNSSPPITPENLDL